MDAVIRRSRAATSSMAALREVAVVGAPHRKWLEAVVALIVVAQGLALDEGRSSRPSGRLLKRPCESPTRSFASS